MQRRRCCLGCLGLTGLILIGLGIVTICLFDPFINKYIDEQLVIRNGSEVYKVWKDPPVVPYLFLYFFNVTNPEEFVDGQKPVLEQIGPYCYREHWRKVNVSFHDNGTVSYQTQRFYHFDPVKSKGTESDIVQTINIPLISAVMKLRYSHRYVRLALSSILEVLKEKTITQHTVKELVWGYEDALIKLAKDILPPDKSFPYDKFGFFYNKNGSTDGLFNVFTGATNMKKYMTIDTFDHQRDLGLWKTKECNMINGTDGSSYPPNLTKNTTLYMFNKNLCRSLPLVYWKDVEHYGVTGYRFTPPADVFAYPKTNPENACFCLDLPCDGGGVFNVSHCQFGAPTLMSWPHFYQADQKYRDAVVGLNPDPEKHALYIDIAPRAGIPLRAQARVQINIGMTSVEDIKQSEHLPTMTFPVLWFEDGVMNMPDELISKIQLSQNAPEVTKTTLISIFFVFGTTLAIVWFVSFVAKLFAININHLNPINEEGTPNRSKTGEIKGYSNPAMSSGSHVDNP